MALFVPSTRRAATERNYSGRPSVTWGTALTASATPHALSSTRTTVVAATTYEAEWVRITITGMHIAATVTDALVNIYIGAASAEVLFIDSLQCGWSADGANGAGADPVVYWFPVRIPRNTRISATLRSLIASDTCQLLVELGVSNGEHWVGSGVETLGEDTANSRGTAVTPGTTSEGTFTNIGTSGRRYRYIVPGVQGNNDTTLVIGWVGWDVGVGGAVYQNMENFMVTDSTNELHSYWTGGEGFWGDIPSGTALQLRAQHHGTVSGLQYATLYGVY